MAAAEAAIRDTDFTARCADLNARMRERLRNSLIQMGIGCDESFANFVLARFADPAEAEAADAALRNDGILVRRVAGYGLPAALRITVGDEDGTSRVIDSLGRFMAGRRGE